MKRNKAFNSEGLAEFILKVALHVKYYFMIEVLANTTMVTILQYINASNQHAVHLNVIC